MKYKGTVTGRFSGKAQNQSSLPRYATDIVPWKHQFVTVEFPGKDGIGADITVHPVKRNKCDCPLNCRYCGKRRSKDSVGHYCKTDNCQWQHGYSTCKLTKEKV